MDAKLPGLSVSTRLRRTPFSRRVEAAGARAYTVYNHMLLPTVFRTIEEDYDHLRRSVQVWDVAGERQVEVRGPDALRLVQMTTPRNLSRMQDDQCYYIPVTDTDAGMLNDPVLIKLDEERYWVSLADSDLLLYFKGLAAGFAMNVSVFEPDVSPLAIQGPLSDELALRVFGKEVVALKHFRHRLVQINGRNMVMSRSGWSHQGGFEIYLEGSGNGEALWDLLFEAGDDLDVRAGCPNAIERVMSGLLSYGNDITSENTPFEAGLGRFCSHEPTGYLGHEALRAGKDPERQIRAVEIEGEPVPTIAEPWPAIGNEGLFAGRVTSAAWVPELSVNVAIAMLERSHWAPGTAIHVETSDGMRAATVQASFWL